jgi:hypothetical protein
MMKRTSIVVLVAALAGAGVFAAYHSDAPASPRVASPATAAHADMAETTTLPPGHPSISGMNGAHDAPPAAPDDFPAAITWTAPGAWKTMPSSSAMRLATYRIPRAPGETEDTELTVVRAGGSTDANIERWLGQFDDRGKDTRTIKTIHGMTATVVEVHGTFLGGGMSMGATESSRTGWALLAAIVETPGSPYFFKMTGPTKSVTAARPAFDALLASITPASP